LALKLLLKRGALVAAANWQTVGVQFAAQTTFQMLLAVPIVGAAILVAVLLGADLANLLQGSLREIFTTIADALVSEPVALAAFITAFAIVLLGGSIFMFLVKGGTVAVLIASNEAAGPIERGPITLDALRSASCFSLRRFMNGCRRLFPHYVVLGLVLMAIYAVSGAGYLVLVVVGYRTLTVRGLMIEWTLVAATAAIALVVWITVVNLVYLLLQVAIAHGAGGLLPAVRDVYRFIRAESRELGGVFLVVFAMVIATTFASALAWSGVGLIAFVPLVGLAVFPLQLLALVVRGLVFEFIGLTALGAYASLYGRHLEAVRESAHAAARSPDARGDWEWRPKQH
jgi:hypothetical protein